MTRQPPPSCPIYARFQTFAAGPPDEPATPAASSLERPWAGMTVQLHDWPCAGSAVSPAGDHDILAMRYSGHACLEQRRLGQVHRGIVVPGNLGLHPRGVESRWSWDRPGAIIITRVPQAILCEAADAVSRRAPHAVELRNCFGARDPFVEPLMNLLAREILQPVHPAQALIAEALSCALAAHLTHRFNVAQWPPAAPAGGLNPRALGRVLDYIHGFPDAAVTLSELAALAAVSRFHFARMFRRSMGESPMAYLERVRLLRAQEMIRSGGYTLAEVACAVGFADQSHFTRRFRRAVGCTPGAYARHFQPGQARPGRGGEPGAWQVLTLAGAPAPLTAPAAPAATDR